MSILAVVRPQETACTPAHTRRPLDSIRLRCARMGEQGGQAPTLEKNQGGHDPPWKF